MAATKLQIADIKHILTTVHTQLDLFYLHVPLDLVRPLATSFRDVLLEYELIRYERRTALSGRKVLKRQREKLRNLRDVIIKVRDEAGGWAILTPAIAELDFLITAEVLATED